MVRLIAPNGASVSVDDEKAERLLAQGFTTQGEQVVKPARRARKAASAATDDE